MQMSTCPSIELLSTITQSNDLLIDWLTDCAHCFQLMEYALQMTLRMPHTKSHISCCGLAGGGSSHRQSKYSPCFLRHMLFCLQDQCRTVCDSLAAYWLYCHILKGQMVNHIWIHMSMACRSSHTTTWRSCLQRLADSTPFCWTSTETSGLTSRSATSSSGPLQAKWVHPLCPTR